MENVYKTRFIFHVKSLRFVLIGSALSFLIFYFILTSQKEEFHLRAFMFGSLTIFLVLSTPAFYLHITYYIKNFGQKIIVNESQNRLTVVKYGKQSSYSYSSIVSTEQHLGLYYRNKIDRLARRLAPWTPYGYIIIKLDNGMRFQLTSLMIDIHNPPFKATHTFFRFFPFLKIGKEFSEKRVIIKQNFENEISHYKLTFKNDTDRQLEEKIRNYKAYDEASVEASRQLLANRRK